MKKKTLGIFSLIAINIIAVDNLRSLPFSAAYGFPLIFFYLVGALCFFIPIGLVSAELASTFPERGGLYVWISKAMGQKMGFFVIYLQWIYNVVWYPTIMGLVGATLFYLFDPALAENKIALFIAVVALFWIATAFNWFGMRISSAVSHVGAIVGTIVPMLFISLLGIIWWVQGHPLAIEWQFFPHFEDLGSYSFLVAILFGLIGMEMSASHADEVKNPHRDFPWSIAISSVIILASLMMASLAIAFVVPSNELNVLTGLIQAYQAFLSRFHLEGYLPLVEVLIILGGLSSVAAWVIGPSKGLFMAAHHGHAPAFFKKLNKHGVPTNILLLQGIIFTALSTLYIFMPTIASSYWTISAMTSQLALLVYIALFLAALILRYKETEAIRPYRVPGGKVGIWLCALLGMISSIGGILIGFFPPSQVDVGNIYLFEALLIGGMVVIGLIPFFLYPSKP